MSKYKKPLRNVHQELFDEDLTHDKQQELKEAYSEFWLTLDEQTRADLDSMLL